MITPAPLGSSTWLLRLRSFAIAGQLITIILADLFTPTKLPLVPLLASVCITVVTNLFYGWWLARRNVESAPFAQRSQRVAFTLMAVDMSTLTSMLYYTGGADNPFSFFYFVNLAVGGVMLEVQAVWTLSALAVVGYTFLLIASHEVPGLSVQTVEGPRWMIGTLDLREAGLLLAFATCVSVVTYFVTRTARQLRNREEDLRRTQAERADAMRLEGLTTLAAGAAHELATPLSTIDIACRELTRHLDGIDKPQSIDDDLQLIDRQLLMCRQILSRMRSAAGDAVADQWHRTTLGDLIDTTLEGIRDPHRVEVVDASPSEADFSMTMPLNRLETAANRLEESASGGEESADWESREMWLPEEAVAQAVRNLIHNALDASPMSHRVIVHPMVDLNVVRLHIIDSGSGMSDDVLTRAGDPFFTTKEPGRGIGLGLFLTRNVVTRLGGSLSFDTTPGRGTRATLTLPLVETGAVRPGQTKTARL